MNRRQFTKRIFAASAFSSFLLEPVLWRTHSLVHSLKNTFLQRIFYSMGTMVTIQVFAESEAHANSVITKVIEDMQHVEQVMSVFRLESDVSKINAHAGKNSVEVDPMLIEILDRAIAAARNTGGAFDVTIEPLMELWSFRETEKRLMRIPSEQEIERALDAVGIGNLVIDRMSNTVGLVHPKAKIDLGGIAVGFAIDRAVKLLRAHGIEDALVNHSGDIYALGSPPEADGWEIAIADPRDARKVLHSFPAKNRAISTSGGYEHFVEYHAKRFGHIMDPRKGMPTDIMQSATVVTRNAMDADVYSTAYFVDKSFAKNNSLPAAMTIYEIDSTFEVKKRDF